ncbi:3'-5' exonuclease, partial [Mycolicibacterium obuense]
RWARRKPEAAARLEAARAAINELAQQVSVPPENLLAPEIVRRLCWDWVATNDTAAAVEAFLGTTAARRWQRELTAPVLTAALESAPGD